MRRRLREILLASLVVPYASTALGGPGLHQIPGCGHARRGCAAGCGGHEPAGPGITASGDCFVCHHQIQGQLPPEAVRLEARPLHRPAARPDPPPDAPTPRFGPARPRGPPTPDPAPSIPWTP